MSGFRLKDKDIENQLCTDNDSESGSNTSVSDAEAINTVVQRKTKLTKHRLIKNKASSAVSPSKKWPISEDPGKPLSKINMTKDFEKNHTNQAPSNNKRCFMDNDVEDCVFELIPQPAHSNQISVQKRINQPKLNCHEGSTAGTSVTCKENNSIHLESHEVVRNRKLKGTSKKPESKSTTEKSGVSCDSDNIVSQRMNCDSISSKLDVVKLRKKILLRIFDGAIEDDSLDSSDSGIESSELCPYGIPVGVCMPYSTGFDSNSQKNPHISPTQGGCQSYTGSELSNVDLKTKTRILSYIFSNGIEDDSSVASDSRDENDQSNVSNCAKVCKTQEIKQSMGNQNNSLSSKYSRSTLVHKKPFCDIFLDACRKASKERIVSSKKYLPELNIAIQANALKDLYNKKFLPTSTTYAIESEQNKSKHTSYKPPDLSNCEVKLCQKATNSNKSSNISDSNMRTSHFICKTKNPLIENGAQKSVMYEGTPSKKRKVSMDHCEVKSSKISQSSLSSKGCSVRLLKLNKSDPSLKKTILKCISSPLSKNEEVDEHEQVEDGSESENLSSDIEDFLDSAKDVSKTIQSVNELSPSKNPDVESRHYSTQTKKLTRSSSKLCSSPTMSDNTNLLKLSLRSRTPQKGSRDSPRKLELKRFSSVDSCSSSKKRQTTCEVVQSKPPGSLGIHNADSKQTTPQKVTKNAYNQMDDDSENDSEGGNKTSKPEDLLECTENESKTIQSVNESSPLKKTDDENGYSSSQTKKLMRSSSKSCSSPVLSDDTSLLKFCLRSRTPQKKNRGSPAKPDLKRFNSILDPVNEDSCEVSSLPSRTRTRSLSITETNKTTTLRSPSHNSESSPNITIQKEERTSKKEKENLKRNRCNVEANLTPDKIEQDELTDLPCSKQNVLLDHNKKVLSPLQKKDITVTTPVSRKNKGRGFLTPTMAKKEHGTNSRSESVMDVTRKQLHISTIPRSLPCRDTEFSQIKSFLLRKIEHSSGGCMYISGVPGTGKTATVHAVIRSLQEEVDEGDVPDFDFVEVNGLRLTEPRQAYVRIYQALTDKKCTPDQAQQLLNRRFSGSCKTSTIVLVDELDYLCNKRQDVVYNILDWPTKRHSALVVLTISNTIDLPERTLKGRVTSRMGLTRLMFHPYSHHQLREIVQDRLCGTTTFHPDAIQLVARKVAAVSGDARRALDICRRTTELVQPGEQVTAAHVEQAVTQIFAGPRVLVIQKLSRLCQLVLRSLRDVNQRTGVDEATAIQVYKHLEQICVLEGFMVPPVGIFLQACVSLVNMGLMVAEKGRQDVTRKMSLNVSSDDIHYALDNVQV